jgi:hypothetical protein
MKKINLLAVLLLVSVCNFAQSENYTKKMKELIAQSDSSSSVDAFNSLSATFERIGDAEKTQWLPFYYAALTKLNAANVQMGGKMGSNEDIADPAADKSEALLTKALALTTESSETWVIKKMIATVRMMGNPMQRYMEYGPKAAEALETAKKMDPKNPRVYILEGQDKFYTPEQFGGSKTEARTLFTKAKELLEAFKPETELHPNWGMHLVNYYLSMKD